MSSSINNDLSWVFRKVPPDGGRDFGNSGFEAFRHSIDTFTREVIQNSLDATLGKPPRLALKFRLIRLRNKDLQQFQNIIQWSSLHDHIKSAAAGAARQRIGHRLKQGLQQVEQEQFLDWLIVEESGTSGLAGPETGEGSFAALCRNNFDSQQKNTAAGGSFGLGKAALWIASRVSTVIFSSSVQNADIPANKNNPRVFGRTELVWHQHGGGDYAGPGWFGQPDEIQDQIHSAWSNFPWLREIGLDRPAGVSGTSIGIVGFHDADSEITPTPEKLLEKLAASAAKWYFPVMTDGRLSVSTELYDSLAHLADRKPTKTTLVDPTADLAPWVATLQDLPNAPYEAELRQPGETVVRHVKLKIPPSRDSASIETVHFAKLLVRKLPPESQVQNGQTIGMLRGRGMIVQYRDPRSNLLSSSSFLAILLAGTAAGNSREDAIAESFLRIAEPPAHDRWEGDGSDLMIHYKRGGKSNLKEFHQEVIQTLKSVLESPQAIANDAPKILRNLFPFGNENPGKIDRPSPRIQELEGRIDAEDRWEIKAKLKLKTAREVRRYRPVLQFDADSGKSHDVRWQFLTVHQPRTVNVEAGQILVVPPKVATIQLSGLTDPATHPISARLARVSLVLKPAEDDNANDLDDEAVEFMETVQTELNFGKD